MAGLLDAFLGQAGFNPNEVQTEIRNNNVIVVRITAKEIMALIEKKEPRMKEMATIEIVPGAVEISLKLK